MNRVSSVFKHHPLVVVFIVNFFIIYYLLTKQRLIKLAGHLKLRNFEITDDFDHYLITGKTGSAYPPPSCTGHVIHPHPSTL